MSALDPDILVFIKLVFSVLGFLSVRSLAKIINRKLK